MERLTIDVEDYYSLVSRDKLGIDVPVSDFLDGEMRRLLDLLDELGVHATCFVVGKVAKDKPHIVRELRERGHEIASHSYEHRRMEWHSPQSFRRDLHESIKALEEIGCGPVEAFRAPAFSLDERHIWAFEIMAEMGIRYDSSVRLIWPWGQRRGNALIEVARSYGITEVPGIALGWRRFRVPLGGGGGLRHLPASLTRWGIKRVRRDDYLIPVYVHPYDLTVGPSRPVWPDADLAKRLRLAFFDWTQHRGRSKVAPQLHDLVPRSRLAEGAPRLESASRTVSDLD